MSKFVRKVADAREPPGMERVLLRRLPMWAAGGTMVPVLCALLNRWFPIAGTSEEVIKREVLVDALAIGAVVTVWTAVLTVAIGCIVVVVMKGPHYVADSYPIDDAPDKPDE